MSWFFAEASGIRLLGRVVELEAELKGMKRRLDDMEFNIAQAKKQKVFAKPKDEEETESASPKGYILS